MAEYKVLVDASVNGTDRKAGDVVALESEVADALVADGTLEVVPSADAGANATAGAAGVSTAAASSGTEPGRSVVKRSFTLSALTQADLDANPLLVELGGVAGDFVAIDKFESIIHSFELCSLAL